jgi:ketosteroid isomerase-like protein
MGRDEVEQVIRGAYAARRAEDVEAALGYFAEDASYRISVSKRLGEYGRTIRGHAELRAAFCQLFATWDWRAFTTEEVIVDETVRPARAAVYSSGRMRHAPSGREFDFETLDLLSVEGGRITSFVEFFDTDMLAQLTAPG